MKAKKNDAEIPYVGRGNVFEDIGFDRSEALELRVKSEIYAELLKHIRKQAFSQSELGGVLGIHQPDVSHLMNGRVSKFSVGKLIQFAGKLNLDAKVTVSKAKGKRVASASVAGGKREVAA